MSDFDKTLEISQAFAARAIAMQEPLPELPPPPSDAPVTMRQFTALALTVNTDSTRISMHERTIGTLVDMQIEHSKRLAVIGDKNYGVRAQSTAEVDRLIGGLHKRINVYAGICLLLVAYIAWLK